MLAQSGVARFENTFCKGYIFWTKIMSHPFLQDKCDDFKYECYWFSENITRLQRHHARPKWSCLFREHSLQKLHDYTGTLLTLYALDDSEDFDVMETRVLV